jgi:flagellar hook-associated protein 3 FlgL
MRITNNMITNSYLNSFNSALERQNKLQEQLADGKQIHRPSDDPIRVVRSLNYNDDLAANEQFTQNVKDATSWMETTDSTMSELSSIMIRAKELVVSADSTKSPDAMKAIGKELDGLINSAIDIGNSQIGDRYLFAGQMDKTQPLTRTTITDPVTKQQVEVVVYNGDDNKISMPTKNGLVDPTQDSVNITGIKAFGPKQDYVDTSTVPATTTTTLQSFNDLLRLKNEFLKTSAVSQSNSTGGAATVGGTYTGTGFQDVTLRITATAGAVTAADFSTDGGTTWTAATADASVPPIFTLGTTGVTTQITTAAGNATGDSYAFHVPYSTNVPDINWMSSVGTQMVDDVHSYMLQAQTELGARSSSYTMIQNMLDDNNTTITDYLSANEDLDIPKAIIEFKNSEAVYNAALSVGSKIMPKSLVDFLS